jgi:BioD-like phosphotransacetylase family protein
MANVIFVAGSVRNCGKTSFSLSLLSYYLHDMKYEPSDIAYIKPCTQCTTPTNVWKFCEHFGIEYVGIGPVVFYPGFTTECIEGKHDASELISKITDLVTKLRENRKIVIVDGVIVSFTHVGWLSECWICLWSEQCTCCSCA